MQRVFQNGFQKKNALTCEEGIIGMTIWAAKAGFLEQEEAAEGELLGAKVVETYSGGKKVY